MDRLYIYAVLMGVASAALAGVEASLFGKGSAWGITTGESKLGGLVWAGLIDHGIADTLYYQGVPAGQPA